MTPRQLIRTLLLTTAAVAVGAAPAPAVTKNGIRPVAPAAGTTVASGKSPVFKMRVRGPGQVWVHVCRSKARNAKGVICHDESIGRARKRDRLHRYKPRFYDFPEFWLNDPGRYFWQAHRIDCSADASDCLREGPVVPFRVG